MWARNAYWWPFSGEESFQVLIWSNKFRMNGIQKMIHVEKWCRKRIHNWKCGNEKNPFSIILWSGVRNWMKADAKVFWNVQNFHFQQYYMYQKSSYIKFLIWKKSNLGLFQKQHGSKKVNYHFYFPMFKIWCLCFRTLF